MTSDTVHSFAWRFGGPLADQPPAVAWSVLGVVALIGLVWIVLGYRRTLVALPRRRRVILTTLRTFVWTVLVVALAGPTRVERTYAHRETRPLAVVVDRSDSMTMPDNRGQRRLDDTLRRWRQIAPEAEKTFGATRVFAFADDVAPIDTPDAAPRLATEQTRLFRSLQSILDQAPAGGWGGVVLLTDGLDTSDTNADNRVEESVRAALAAGTPVYSLVGHNRYSGSDHILVRDLTLPPRVPPLSSFALEITLDTFQLSQRSVPVRLRVGDRWRDPEPVTLAAGRRALAWSSQITAASEGALPIELQVGEGDRQFTARAEVQVVAPDSTRILYYQGSLDWGYRFLADILRRDPAFSLTPIFNLSGLGNGNAPSAPPGSLPHLPDSVAGFDAYDIVVLANASADQFSPAQQTALTAWVRQGGSLLFLAPDDDTTRGFAETELEKMLPVVFARTTRNRPADDLQERFRQRMRQLGGSHSIEEQRFAAIARSKTERPALTAFDWDTAADTLFDAGDARPAPLFASYATVERAKPGATVLARHPSARNSSGNERAVLLALQRYGRGQSAVFASDALWRWKLNQPSTERRVETFWQNLLAWLARERPRGPRFEHAPLTAPLKRELEFRVASADSVAPAVTVEQTRDAIDAHQPVQLAAGESGPSGRAYRWTPPETGQWIVTATDAAGRSARHWIHILDTPVPSETSGHPADTSLLQTLARRTGGVVLDAAAPVAWRDAAANAEPALLKESRRPLWHGAVLLIALLSAYATELVLRRRWQLL